MRRLFEDLKERKQEFFRTPFPACWYLLQLRKLLLPRVEGERAGRALRNQENKASEES